MVHIIRVFQEWIDKEPQELVEVEAVAFKPDQEVLNIQMHHDQQLEELVVVELLLLLIKSVLYLLQKQLVVLSVSIMERPFTPLQDQALSPILLVHLFLLNMFVLPVAVVVVHRIMLEVEVQVDI